MRSPRALALAVALSVGCSRPPGPGEPQDRPPSPQAQVMPAPLATPIAQPSARVEEVAADAGPPATPLRADDVLPADAPPAKEVPAHSLEVVFRSPDWPGPARGGEINAGGLEAARRKAEARARVELSASRLRFVPEGAGFVFPRELELRARADRLGHVALLGGRYRALAPGTLRALFGERRLDVGPLDHAELTPRGEGPRRLGARTRRVELTVRAAKVTVDLAHVAELGEGGVLLCRMLLDLASAWPRTPLCAADDVPLYAELRWSTHGSYVMEVLSFARRPDVAPASLLAPPPQATRAAELFPRERAGRLLGPQDLRALRHGDPGATAAIELVNPSTTPSIAWLDGAPAAWLGSQAQLTLDGLAPGRYQVAWRSVFGDVHAPTEVVVAPGRAVLGGSPDAGKGP